MIRTFAIAAGVAGAILLAPVAPAQADDGTGPGHSDTVGNGSAFSDGPAAGPVNKFAPTTKARPFGSPGSFVDQPGREIAAANGNITESTGIPFGTWTPIARGHMVGPATTTSQVSGIRTRRGRGADASPLSGLLGGLFG